MKDYGHLIARDLDMAQPAAEIAALTRDVSEFIWAIGLPGATAVVPAYRVAYHDPRSMQHVQKVVEQPRALLHAAGFQVVEVPERHFCCGSAGTYKLAAARDGESAGRTQSGPHPVYRSGYRGDRQYRLHDLTRPLSRPSGRSHGRTARLGDLRSGARCVGGRYPARAGARRAGEERTPRQAPEFGEDQACEDHNYRRVPQTFFSEIAAAMGADAVNRSEETLLRYGENTMPGGDRPPAGAGYSASTADVQKIVRSANAHGVPLYPISTDTLSGSPAVPLQRAGRRRRPRPPDLISSSRSSTRVGSASPWSSRA